MVFYSIYANGGGINSILGAVLGHIEIAERRGWIPFVDMELNTNYYSEKHAILGTRNVWEYFFLPVSSVTPSEAYESGNWISSEGRFPFSVMGPLFSGEDWLPKKIQKYVRLRPETKAALDKARDFAEPGPGVLGVHFRGTDMRTTPNHPLPPTEQQIFRRIDRCLDSSNFDSIFLVTEAESYLASFVRRYGTRVRYLNIPRLGKVNIYSEYPRRDHRFLLGLEALVETFLLAECSGLVCGYSGLSEMAQVVGRDNILTVEKIWNGRVPRPKLVADYWWKYRSAAPRVFGGFPP